MEFSDNKKYWFADLVRTVAKDIGFDLSKIDRDYIDRCAKTIGRLLAHSNSRVKVTKGKKVDDKAYINSYKSAHLSPFIIGSLIEANGYRKISTAVTDGYIYSDRDAHTIVVNIKKHLNRFRENNLSHFGNPQTDYGKLFDISADLLLKEFDAVKKIAEERGISEDILSHLYCLSVTQYNNFANLKMVNLSGAITRDLNRLHQSDDYAIFEEFIKLYNKTLMIRDDFTTFDELSEFMKIINL